MQLINQSCVSHILNMILFSSKIIFDSVIVRVQFFVVIRFMNSVAVLYYATSACVCIILIILDFLKA